MILPNILPESMRHWSKLNHDASPIVRKIVRQWRRLLETKMPEEAYQSFLSDHAGLFLARDYDDELIVISKLRLGSDCVVDFVRTHDESSAGICFEFIEIETPWAKPYTKRGRPSARLAEAIQQVQDWKTWMRENRYETHKILPFYNKGLERDRRFEYTILIGNRENSGQWLAQRNDLARELGISIRSFDSIEDQSHRRGYIDFVKAHLTEHCTLDEAIELANPFFKAFSDKNWREFAAEYRKGLFKGSVAGLLLSHREYSEEFRKYTKEWYPDWSCVRAP